MLADIRTAYHKAAEEIQADGIISSGDVMVELAKRGAGKIYRDSCHVSLGLGRYALALTWFAKLSGKDIMDTPFNDLEESMTTEEQQLAKECVRDIVMNLTIISRNLE